MQAVRLQADSDVYTKAVFVIHGRNLNAKTAMFQFLRALDLNPIEWTNAITSRETLTAYAGGCHSRFSACSG